MRKKALLLLGLLAFIGTLLMPLVFTSREVDMEYAVLDDGKVRYRGEVVIYRGGHPGFLSEDWSMVIDRYPFSFVSDHISFDEERLLSRLSFSELRRERRVSIFSFVHAFALHLGMLYLAMLAVSRIRRPARKEQADKPELAIQPGQEGQ